MVTTTTTTTPRVTRRSSSRLSSAKAKVFVAPKEQEGQEDGVMQEKEEELTVTTKRKMKTKEKEDSGESTFWDTTNAAAAVVVTPSPKKRKQRRTRRREASIAAPTPAESKSQSTRSPKQRRRDTVASSSSIIIPPESVKSTLSSSSPKKKKKKILFPPTPSSSTTTSKKKFARTTTTTETSNTQMEMTSEDLETINPDQPFIDLKVSRDELRPSATLTTGQCFHWKAVVVVVPKNTDRKESISTSTTTTTTSAWGSHDATEWIGTIRVSDPTLFGNDDDHQDDGVSIVLVIRETPTTTLYRPLTTVPSTVDLSKVLEDYFQLQFSLKDLYTEWSEACPRLSVIAKCLPGVRLINQDPWECLVSFICSSNNNIPRITKMLQSIRQEYGQPLLQIQQNADGDAMTTMYSFPSLQQLSQKATDEHFRNVCGLGYRSKYILETMKILLDKGGESYLHELRQSCNTNFSPLEIQTKLCEFVGVGPKVADCVAIFSLQQDSVIPVDTHVWNIARRDYDDDDCSLLETKSLTPKIYQRVGELFRKKFPQKAAWAHSLLFVAELPSFQRVLPAHIIQEMEQFKIEEQQRKNQLKANKKKTPKDKSK